MLKTATEAEFQRTVVELAKLRGWLVHHTRPAVNRRGRWSTPIQGDPGFPDLVLCKNGVLIVAELKREGGKASWEQMCWLEMMVGAEVRGYVWRPGDWDVVCKMLARY